MWEACAQSSSSVKTRIEVCTVCRLHPAPAPGSRHHSIHPPLWRVCCFSAPRGPRGPPVLAPAPFLWEPRSSRCLASRAEGRNARREHLAAGASRMRTRREGKPAATTRDDAGLVVQQQTLPNRNGRLAIIWIKGPGQKPLQNTRTPFEIRWDRFPWTIPR